MWKLISLENRFATVQDVFTTPYIVSLCKRYFKDTRKQNNWKLIRNRRVSEYYAYLLHEIFSDRYKMQDFLMFMREQLLVNNEWENVLMDFDIADIQLCIHTFIDLHFRLEETTPGPRLRADMETLSCIDAMKKSLADILIDADENINSITTRSERRMLTETLDRGIFPINSMWDISVYCSDGNDGGYITHSLITQEPIEVDRLWTHLHPWYEIINLVWENLSRNELLERKEILQWYLDFHLDERKTLKADEADDFIDLYDKWLEGCPDYNPEPWIHINDQEGGRWFYAFKEYLEDAISQIERKAMRADLAIV